LKKKTNKHQNEKGEKKGMIEKWKELSYKVITQREKMAKVDTRRQFL
jgi:hypothetical protein